MLAHVFEIASRLCTYTPVTTRDLQGARNDWRDGWTGKGCQ